MKYASLIVLALVATSSLLWAPRTQAAEEFYMTVDGQRQGKFKGEGTGKTANRISAVDFSYEIVSPRDIQSGLPTGQRMHKPVVITLPWSAGVVQLFTALVTNENLKSVLIEFSREAANGQEEIYQTIKLTNANMASIRLRTSDDILGRRIKSPELAEVAFTFQKIEITHKPSSTTAQDDWEARVN